MTIQSVCEAVPASSTNSFISDSCINYAHFENFKKTFTRAIQTGKIRVVLIATREANVYKLIEGLPCCRNLAHLGEVVRWRDTRVVVCNNPRAVRRPQLQQQMPTGYVGLPKREEVQTKPQGKAYELKWRIAKR